MYLLNQILRLLIQECRQARIRCRCRLSLLLRAVLRKAEEMKYPSSECAMMMLLMMPLSMMKSEGRTDSSYCGK